MRKNKMYLSAIKNYFSIKGRINRQQFFFVWILTLFVCGLLVGIICNEIDSSEKTTFYVFTFLYFLLLLPSRIKSEINRGTVRFDVHNLAMTSSERANLSVSFFMPLSL